MDRQGSCPLTMKQVLQEYFIENRTRVLEIAAFLDRLERAADAGSSTADFRLAAFGRALNILASNDPDKIGQIQLVFSDPTIEPKPALDTKSASGAWNPATGVN
jgi:hypothetical protein